MMFYQIPFIHRFFEDLFVNIGMNLKDFLTLLCWDSKSLKRKPPMYLEEFDKYLEDIGRRHRRDLIFHNIFLSSAVLSIVWAYIKYVIGEDSKYYGLMDLVVSFKDEKKGVLPSLSD